MSDNCSRETVELSEEAEQAMSRALETARGVCLEGFYDGKAPDDCCMVATCGALVIVDQTTTAVISAEVRSAYDNSHCLQVCALNVLNPGYIPRATVKQDMRDQCAIPGDING